MVASIRARKLADSNLNMEYIRIICSYIAATAESVEGQPNTLIEQAMELGLPARKKIQPKKKQREPEAGSFEAFSRMFSAGGART